MRGGRRIDAGEAAIVRRIFTAFAGGSSPKAIAKALNAEGIPGPRGELWRDTTIRGHRQRGTGLLNNELYVGRLVWNRLRYVKDPSTGKRVSRKNDAAELVVVEVPELRIVDDELWQAVKASAGTARGRTHGAEDQGQPVLGAAPARRISCSRACWSAAVCGGGYAIDRPRLSRLRQRPQPGHLRQPHRTIRRTELEELVLDVLRDRLMAPELLTAFVAGYTEECNRLGPAPPSRRAGAGAASWRRSSASCGAGTRPSRRACARRACRTSCRRWRPARGG